MTAFGIRGTFVDFIEDPWRHVGHESEAARFHADGLLVVEDGRIADFGAHDEVAARHAGLVVTTISDRLILPGFIDGHVHFPQTRVIGAFGEHLLPWLQKWVFPEEIKFKDRAYAREAAGRFFDNLLASGTTTCQAFTTTASAATEELFDEAARRNMRLIAGLTGIDRLAPADYALSAENFYRDSKRLIERYHRQGRGLYAITPRNAHVSTPDLMAACVRTAGSTRTCRRRSVNARRCAPSIPTAPTISRSTRSMGWSGRSSRVATACGCPTTSSAASRPAAGRSPSARARTCSLAAACSASAAPRIRRGASGCRSAATSAAATASPCSTSWTTPTRSAWLTTPCSTIPPRPSATSSRPIAASGRSRWAAPKDSISTIWLAT